MSRTIRVILVLLVASLVLLWGCGTGTGRGAEARRADEATTVGDQRGYQVVYTHDYERGVGIWTSSGGGGIRFTRQ